MEELEMQLFYQIFQKPVKIFMEDEAFGVSTLSFI